MAETENYNGAGDYRLKELTLENYVGDVIDITSMFTNIVFVEDIFASTVFGKIVLVDGLDLVQYLPIIGQEKLVFRFQTHKDSKTLTKTFHTFKVADKRTNAQESNVYTLPFTSFETLIDQNTRVSESFRGQSCSQIVSGLFRNLESEKDLVTTPTSGSHSVVIPNWNPIEAINWVSSFAQPVQYDRSHFLFYENANGFNFRHIEEIIDDEPVKEIETKIANIAEGEGADGQMRPGNSPSDVRVIKQTDVLKGITEGMFGSRVISYDNVSKQININDSDYGKEFERHTSMGNFPLVTKDFLFGNPEQYTTIVPTTSLRENSSYYRRTEGTANGRTPERVANSRSGLLSQITANQICLELPGDVDITAGVMLSLLIPNRTAVDDKKQKKSDKFLSQKVMVSKVVHQFSRGHHWMKVYALKDSYDNEPTSDISK